MSDQPEPIEKRTRIGASIRSLFERCRSWTKPSDPVLLGLRRLNISVQFLAALFALVTFTMWMLEADIRREENDLRRSDLFLKMSDVIDRGRDRKPRAITDKAFKYLTDVRRTGQTACGFDYSNLWLNDVQIFTNISCGLRLYNTMLMGATIRGSYLRICENCDPTNLYFLQDLFPKPGPSRGESFAREVASLPSRSMIEGMLIGNNIVATDLHFEGVITSTHPGIDIWLGIPHPHWEGLARKGTSIIDAGMIDIVRSIIFYADIQNGLGDVHESLLYQSNIHLFRGDRFYIDHSILVDSDIFVHDRCRPHVSLLGSEDDSTCELPPAEYKLTESCRRSSSETPTNRETVKLGETSKIIELPACDRPSVVERLEELASDGYGRHDPDNARERIAGTILETTIGTDLTIAQAIDDWLNQ